MDFNDKYNEKSFFDIKLSKGKGGVGEFEIKSANIKFHDLNSKGIIEGKIKLDYTMVEDDINFVKKFISNLNLLFEKKIYHPNGKITISSDSIFSRKEVLFDKGHISEVFKSDEMSDLINVIKRNIIHTDYNLDELKLLEENLKKLEIPNTNLSENFIKNLGNLGSLKK
jgi:hypothetical protein